MKLIPSTIILIATVASGYFLGTSLVDDEILDQTEVSKAPDSAETQRVARKHALRLIERRVAEFEASRNVSKEEKDKKFFASVADLSQTINDMNEIMERTEGVVDGLKDSLGEDLNPGERAVVSRTARSLSDKLVLGRTLISATQSSIRREGLRLLEHAAMAGESEALRLIIQSLNDGDASFAREAMRRARNLAKSADQTVLDMVKESGLEGDLVAMLPSKKGADFRTVLDALTALKSPAAIQGWRQVFTADSGGNRNRMTAARSLKELGSPQEYQQILTSYDADLASGEANISRNAVNNLRRLGGEEAKKTLQRALVADPQGPNARSIKNALRRMERSANRRRRSAAGSGAPTRRG